MQPQTRKNPVIKYVMKDDRKEDIFHSSAYGVSQNGSNMGTASTVSFSARQALTPSNRQFVRGFNESKIATSVQSGMPRAKAYTPPVKTQGPTPIMPRNPGISR